MRLIFLISLLIAAAARAGAVTLEEAASAVFRSGGQAGLSALQVPLLPEPRAWGRAAAPDQAWVESVKRAYRASPIGGLPPAQLAELPQAALRQMQEDAQVYPSRAYLIVAAGRPAYVIENDNLEALFVNIFDGDGRHIAFGGVDENYDFWWLPPSARAAEELSVPEYCRINDRALNALDEQIMTRESPRDPVTGNLYIDLRAEGPAGKLIKARVINVRHYHPGDQFHIEVYAGGKLIFKSGRQDNPIFIGFQVDDVPFSLTCFEDIRGREAASTLK